MSNNSLSKLVITLVTSLFAVVVIMECTQCTHNDEKPPIEPETNPFKNSAWASQRVEFLLSEPGGQEVRMNFPSDTKGYHLDLFEKDFKIKLGDYAYGKYEVGGKEQFITLRPNDGKPTLNLEVNRDCKDEKLVMELSKDESKTIFASIIVETNPYISPDLAKFLNEGDVRLRFEFTRDPK